MAETNDKLITPEDGAGMQSPSEDEETSVVHTLSGQQKATALLIAMGKPTAARFLKYFTPDELRKLSGQARNLPDIKISDFEKLVQQFEEAFAEGASFSRAEERFTSLVRETLPEDEAAAILNPNQDTELSYANVFEIMNRMTAEELHPYLTNEHPQIIAYIVSRLPDELAARVLVAQIPEVRSSIVQRILDLKPVHAAADAIISQAMYPILVKHTESKKKSHYKRIATILNQLDKNDLDSVMTSLESIGIEDMSNIQALMFMFEDIPRLTNRARLLLFDEIPLDTVITALRDADTTLIALVLASLSQRTRRMVEAELATPDIGLSRDAIIRARREVASTALGLAQQGKINLDAERTSSITTAP
ncbi:MAG: flagellar motor switch protein FliG [Candidatus Tokpelaia sp. JSC188]|nr:MAG: flagellar motor switch protein FliG [Candidatus Tokpelaia sp. JSC188]